MEFPFVWHLLKLLNLNYYENNIQNSYAYIRANKEYQNETKKGEKAQ